MPKLKPSALPQEDIEKYLQENEDFAFEMSCVANLVNLGLEVEHGGTYSDPVTNLKRQFDIRAYYEYADRAQIAFAIECKNLKANFPLVVSRVPRTRDEAFHEIFCPAESRGVISAGHGPLGRAKRIDSTGSFYVINQPVGKSTIQIGRLENDQFYANDSEVYEKWAQAVASYPSRHHAVFKGLKRDKVGGCQSTIYVVVSRLKNASAVWMITGTVG